METKTRKTGKKSKKDKMRQK